MPATLAEGKATTFSELFSAFNLSSVFTKPSLWYAVPVRHPQSNLKLALKFFAETRRVPRPKFGYSYYIPRRKKIKRLILFFIDIFSEML